MSLSLKVRKNVKGSKSSVLILETIVILLITNAGGQSTVDLGIVSEIFFNQIEKFMIFPQTELSDHCKITLQIPNMINPKINFSMGTFKKGL